MIDIQNAPENGDPTRLRIVRLASEKYRRFGFARVSIEEICRDLRMAKKTFYKHFRNRDELVEAVIVEFARAIQPKVAELFQSDCPPLEIIECWFSFITSELPKHMTREFLADLEIHMPDLWEQVRQTRAAILAGIQQVLERGVADGSIHPDIDPKVFAPCYVALVDTVARGGFLLEHDLTIEAVIVMFRRLLASGLRNTTMEDPS